MVPNAAVPYENKEVDFPYKVHINQFPIPHPTIYTLTSHSHVDTFISFPSVLLEGFAAKM